MSNLDPSNFKLPPPVGLPSQLDLRPPPVWIRIWLVALPPARRAQARGAAMFGLFFAVPLMLGALFVAFGLPLWQRPGDRDLGGLICFAPAVGVTTALVLHFLACARGYRLSFQGVLVVLILLGAAAGVANKTMPDLKLGKIKQEIAQGNAGAPEFTADAQFKQGLCAILDQTSHIPHPILYVRYIADFQKTPATKSDKELALWKLDSDFAEYAHYNMDIPGAKPAWANLSVARIRAPLAAALGRIVPEHRLKIEDLSAKDSAAGSAVLEVSSMTCPDGTYTKMTSDMGKPILLANFHVDWQVKLVDPSGTVLYHDAWTTRPAEGLSLADVPMGSHYAPYQLKQFSACDNFTRGLLGRLGLPPGPVKTQWSYTKDF